MRARYLFILIFFWVLPFNTVFANVYFDQILNFVTGGRAKMNQEKNLPETFVSGLLPKKNESEKFEELDKITNPTIEDISNENIFLDKEANYFEESEGSLQTVDSVKKEDKQDKSYLGTILEKLKVNSEKTPTVVSNNTSQQPTTQNTLPTNNNTPSLFQQPSFLNSLLSGSGLGQNSPFGSPSGSPLGSLFSPNGSPSTGPLSTQPTPVPTSNQVPTPATLYNGPGGSLPGDCGIPKGPIAYNIGNKNGQNVSCNATTIVSGYKGQLRKDKFAAGYINPLTEKGDRRAGSSAGNCRDSSTANQYGEGCFQNYSLGSPGAAYIQEQILHWQQQGEAKGQKCVPVDIDNCDSIGADKYKQILDQVELLNNRGSVKIKVLNKNPHLAGCNFLSHPAVVGAFIEEISPSDAKKVAAMRSKPEQILVFARGGSGSNQKLKQIENLKIPNSTFSYDSGGEYEKVYDCTYNP